MPDSTPPVPPPDPPPAVPPPVPGPPVPPQGPPWAGYGQPYASYQPAAQNSGKAVAILVLGIVSLVMVMSCCIGAIPAIVALAMAGGAKREIAASAGRLTGESLIKGGVICSWISIGLSVVFFVLIIGLIAFGAFAEPDYQNTGPGIQSTMALLRP